MNIQLIAERIKEIRVENELSQTQFGNMLSVSQDTVSLWERAKSIPTTEIVYEIAKKFDVSADFILGLVDY